MADPLEDNVDEPRTPAFKSVTKGFAKQEEQNFFEQQIETTMQNTLDHTKHSMLLLEEPEAAGMKTVKVVIDAFRTIAPNPMMMNQEPRPSILQTLIYGLNRHCYSININCRCHELEQKMLLNLNKRTWMDSLELKNYDKHCEANLESLLAIVKVTKAYHKNVHGSRLSRLCCSIWNTYVEHDCRMDEQQLKRLGEHKYSSFLDEYCMKKQVVPRWCYLLCAVGLLLYQTIDATDGKQARLTNSASTLGELFDHGLSGTITRKLFQLPLQPNGLLSKRSRSRPPATISSNHHDNHYTRSRKRRRLLLIVKLAHNGCTSVLR